MGSSSSAPREEPLGPGGMTPQQLYYLQHNLYGGQPFLSPDGDGGDDDGDMGMFGGRGGADLMMMFPPAPQVPRAPPPAMRESYVVRNDVNLSKASLKMVRVGQSGSKYRVAFTFDANRNCAVSVFVGCSERIDESGGLRFEPAVPAALAKSRRVVFASGGGLRYEQEAGECLDLAVAFPDPAGLRWKSGDARYPLLILLEATDEPPGTSPIRTEVPPTSEGGKRLQCQLTYAEFVPPSAEAEAAWAAANAGGEGEAGPGPPIGVRVLKQRVHVEGKTYELNEIYGSAGGAAPATVDDDDAGDCVVCLTEKRTTTVLPCRHMCLCRGCADKLRYQSHKCPMCRAPVEELLNMALDDDDDADVKGASGGASGGGGGAGLAGGGGGGGSGTT